MELFYKGGVNCKARALAVCEVSGGPSYDIPLLAESSAVAYRLDKARVDFGLLQYDRVEERELNLHNTGRVPLSFQVVKSLLSRPNVVEVVPGGGSVGAGEKQRLRVRVLPGRPEVVRETFQLQVGCWSIQLDLLLVFHATDGLALTAYNQLFLLTGY